MKYATSNQYLLQGAEVKIESKEDCAKHLKGFYGVKEDWKVRMKCKILQSKYLNGQRLECVACVVQWSRHRTGNLRVLGSNLV